MTTQPFHRARRVSGAPYGVVAWVDHEHHAELLCLNADRFTTQQEQRLNALLAMDSISASEVLGAIASPGG
ncbi:hypothetical protein [Streptomyces griseus]|uniref:hypothetical protein n=1 Tax=Streptomyces griseus TaxID=1911 RepID=UPI00117CD8FF|nr:hypothetical protein [Streptomyces fimicarius]